MPEGNGEGESRGRGEGETRGEGEGEKKGEGEGETRGEREGEVWAGAGWSERGPWTSGDRREGGGAAEQGGEGGRREGGAAEQGGEGGRRGGGKFDLVLSAFGLHDVIRIQNASRMTSAMSK